jgi:hypothetical protein
MSNLLSTAKKVLFDHAVEIYQLFGEDIPLEKEEFKNHYSNLGEVLFEIESIESFTDLISKLETGFFSQLGYHPDDEDMLEEFLKALEKSR